MRRVWSLLIIYQRAVCANYSPPFNHNSLRKISANSNQSVLVFSDRLFEASKHLSENAVSLNDSQELHKDSASDDGISRERDNSANE